MWHRATDVRCREKLVRYCARMTCSTKKLLFKVLRIWFILFLPSVPFFYSLMSTPSSATASRSNSTSTASSTTTTTVNDEQINTLLTRDINHHHHHRMKWTPMNMSHPLSPSLSLGQDILVTISYLAIILLIAFVTTCLFCFFLAIRLLDDMIHTVVPERLWAIARHRLAAVDWVATLSRWSLRLASLAEWEKNRRASLYPTLSKHFAHIDGERLHTFLFSLTGLLSSYTNRRTSTSSSTTSWNALLLTYMYCWSITLYHFFNNMLNTFTLSTMMYHLCPSITIPSISDGWCVYVSQIEIPPPPSSAFDKAEIVC